MQPVKLAASILLFLIVVAVFGYLFYQPIYGTQETRLAVMLALRDAAVASPDTNLQQFEPRVHVFNVLPETADVIVEYRDRTTQESKFFRYSMRYHDGQWIVTKREPFVPPNRQ